MDKSADVSGKERLDLILDVFATVVTAFINHSPNKCLLWVERL